MDLLKLNLIGQDCKTESDGSPMSYPTIWQYKLNINEYESLFANTNLGTEIVTDYFMKVADRWQVNNIILFYYNNILLTYMVKEIKFRQNIKLILVADQNLLKVLAKLLNDYFNKYVYDCHYNSDKSDIIFNANENTIYKVAFNGQIPYIAIDTQDLYTTKISEVISDPVYMKNIGVLPNQQDTRSFDLTALFQHTLNQSTSTITTNFKFVNALGNLDLRIKNPLLPTDLLFPVLTIGTGLELVGDNLINFTGEYNLNAFLYYDKANNQYRIETAENRTIDQGVTLPKLYSYGFDTNYTIISKDEGTYNTTGNFTTYLHTKDLSVIGYLLSMQDKSIGDLVDFGTDTVWTRGVNDDYTRDEIDDIVANLQNDYNTKINNYKAITDARLDAIEKKVFIVLVKTNDNTNPTNLTIRIDRPFTDAIRDSIHLIDYMGTRIVNVTKTYSGVELVITPDDPLVLKRIWSIENETINY